VKEYVSTVLEVNEDSDRIYKLLAEQMHLESVIIAKKFKNVRKCIYYFILSLIF
jgi:hypothetical protein